MTKMALGLPNHWRMANSGVGIMPRDLTLAEIRLNTLIGIRRGWHYNRGQYSGGALYLQFDRCKIYIHVICVKNRYKSSVI